MTTVFQYLNLLWQVTQFLSGLIGLSHGGGILLFVREDIPCKIIKSDCDADFEGIFGEINLRIKNGYFVVLTIHIKVIS